MKRYKILERAGLVGIVAAYLGAMVILFYLIWRLLDQILNTGGKLFAGAAIICCILSTQAATAQSISLNEAIRQNDLTTVEALLRNGANPNDYDDDSDYTLINAAMYASVECVELLLKSKANPNLANRFGQRPLMLSTDDVDKMKLLIRYGANINDTSRSGNCALLMACTGYGKYRSVKWLLDNGADVSAKRWMHETALMRAVRFSDTMTIHLLLDKGLDVNAHPWGYTPLMIAVRLGNWDAVFCLLNHGADVNMADEDNNPPVMWAAVAGHFEAVNAMMPKVKNINTKNIRAGMTPLMWATVNEHDDPRIIQAFLEKGAHVNTKATDGSTALSWAQKKGNTATVALLKKAGAQE